MKLLALLALAIPALGQVESVVSRTGDDPRWADPAWREGWGTSVDPLSTRYWVRYEVRIPDRILDPVIGLPGSTMEVYAEGRLIGRHGSLPPDFQDSRRGYFTYPLPIELATPGRRITVALRIWDPPGAQFRGWTRLPPLSIHSAGETPLYQRDAQESRVGRGYLWSAFLMALVLVMLGVAGRSVDKGPEFRLVTLFCGAYLVWNLVWAAAYSYPWARGALFVTCGSSVVFLVTAMELTAVFAGLRPAWWLRAAQFAHASGQILFGFAHLYTETPWWLSTVAPFYLTVGLLPALTGLGVLLAQRATGWTPRLLPMVLTASLSCVGIGRVLRSSGLGVPPYVRFGDFFDLPITLVGHLAFGVTLLAGMLLRLRRTSQLAQELQGQMAAARGVQELLLNTQPPATPGYAIDPVYRSAQEVGGDLFRILPAPGGETLLLVGDVSGKGLKAAMLVSVIVGALLNRRSSEPARVLEELNRAITGQLEGGFVTCCAVLLQADGRMEIANAGHLVPYLDGEPLELPAGLPLGVIAEAQYESAAFSFAQGGQLTLLSDGVVEAENAQRELFGFDRTRELSTKSAREIAEAARAWGQNDDITVVTVRRNS